MTPDLPRILATAALTVAVLVGGLAGLAAGNPHLKPRDIDGGGHKEKCTGPIGACVALRASVACAGDGDCRFTAEADHWANRLALSGKGVLKIDGEVHHMPELDEAPRCEFGVEPFATDDDPPLECHTFAPIWGGTDECHRFSAATWADVVGGPFKKATVSVPVCS